MGKFTKRGRFQITLDANTPSHKPVVEAQRVLKAYTSIEVQEEARKYSSAALKALRDIVKSKVSSDLARIAAAQTLLDRAHGRPTQTNINATVNTDGKPSEVTESELNRRIKETLTRVEGLTRRKREKIKDETRPPDVRLLN